MKEPPEVGSHTEQSRSSDHCRGTWITPGRSSVPSAKCPSRLMQCSS